jgi:hypothetical protein
MLRFLAGLAMKKVHDSQHEARPFIFTIHADGRLDQIHPVVPRGQPKAQSAPRTVNPD